MKSKITIKLVNSLKPKDKVYDVYDTEISGFVLRVRPTGRMTYLLFYRNKKGGKRTNTIGHGLTAVQARDIAKERYADIAKGIDINELKKAIKHKADKEKMTTLSNFLESVYKPWLLDNRKSGKDAYERLARSFTAIAHRQLDQINSWDIVTWRKTQKSAGLSEHTTKRNLAELKSMSARAKEWGFIVSNPLADVKATKVTDNRVDRYLSDIERQSLFKALDQRETELRLKRESGNKWREARGYELLACHSTSTYVDHLKPMVLLALNTGLRRGELFSLEWASVNLSNLQLTITSKSAKSKKARHIPLNHQASDTLRSWGIQASKKGLVFPNRNGTKLDNIRKSWATLLESAGINNFRFHDLRHDFASQLVMKGVDLYVVKELLGHSSIQVTERYAHLAPKQLEDAVNLLNG